MVSGVMDCFTSFAMTELFTKRSSGSGLRHEFWQVSHLAKQSAGTSLLQCAALLLQRAIGPNRCTGGDTRLYSGRRVLDHEATLWRHLQVLRCCQIACLLYTSDAADE